MEITIGSNNWEKDIPYKFEKNPFKYILVKYNFKRKNVKHHLAREKIEVETWIKTIGDVRWQAYWMLLAIALRKTEAVLLKREQFDLEYRAIFNIIRKGDLTSMKISQSRLGLPEWCIKPLKHHFKTIQNLEEKSYFLVSSKINMTRWAKKHFLNLMKMKENLESQSNLSIYYQKLLLGLQLINEKGYITPHQLRATWDTLSSGKDKMEDSNRRYHMNHRLEGSDEHYIQIESIDTRFQEYQQDLDENSPYYNIE